MTRKCHDHIPQTNTRSRKEELKLNNSETTPEGKNVNRQALSLSLPHRGDYSPLNYIYLACTPQPPRHTHALTHGHTQKYSVPPSNQPSQPQKQTAPLTLWF